MQTKVIEIGNSRGIRIPNNILKSLNIVDVVDLIVDDNKCEIILKPVKKSRDNWAEVFKKMNQNGDDHLIIDDSIDLDSDQWEW